MTLQEVFDHALQKAKANAQESCAFDLSCLLEEVFGIDRYALPLRGTQMASPEQTAQFNRLVALYLAGEPLQYLLGEWAFFGLPFLVGPGVLIPRPDTETLVETALSLLEVYSAPVIADLCAGSGCVSVSLAHKRPDAAVYALELSERAFPYLAKNIQKNASPVRAMHCDVLDPPELPLFDLVVSNPPYLSEEEMHELQQQVTYEPAMALAGGVDGYDFYRLLPVVWYDRIKPGGWIALEVGYTQAADVADLLRERGYTCVSSYRDLCGIERVVVGRTKV